MLEYLRMKEEADEEKKRRQQSSVSPNSILSELKALPDPESVISEPVVEQAPADLYESTQLQPVGESGGTLEGMMAPQEESGPMSSTNIRALAAGATPLLIGLLSGNMGDASEIASKGLLQEDRRQLQEESTLMSYLQKSQLVKDKAAATAGKGGFKDAMSLRRMWAGMPVTKDTQKIVQSYSKIRSAKNTPAGNMGMIFNFMKMLDPASVVRESEFREAGKAGELPDRYQNWFNIVVKAKKLSPKQRKDFIETAHEIYARQKRLQENIDVQFKGMADQGGISSSIPIKFGKGLGLDALPKFEVDKDEAKQSVTKFGHIEDGYKFIGRDGADDTDPKNWEKVK